MSPVSTFFDGASLTQLRGLAWLRLSDTGRVLTRGVVDDSGGSTTETFTAGSYVPCRIDPVGGGEDTVADRLEDRTTHVITVAGTVTISSNDRFQIGSQDYEITAVRQRTRQVLKELEAVPTTA